MRMAIMRAPKARHHFHREVVSGYLYVCGPKSFISPVATMTQKHPFTRPARIIGAGKRAIQPVTVTALNLR